MEHSVHCKQAAINIGCVKTRVEYPLSSNCSYSIISYGAAPEGEQLLASPVQTLLTRKGSGTVPRSAPSCEGFPHPAGS